MIKNNTPNVINAMSDASKEWLIEVASEILSQAQRNTAVGRVGGGQTKASFRLGELNEADMSITVGSDSKNAIWEEYGTGDYAINGDGRKGGWYVMVGEGRNQISESVVKAYGYRIYYGKNGKRFIHTYGKRPKRAFQKAIDKVKKTAGDKLAIKMESRMHD